MSNDSSLTAGNFELENQSGVANLLLAIRSSDIDKGHKNELRDLVFQYMNSGQDESIRIALEQKLSKFSIKPVPVKQQSVQSSTNSRPKLFGSTRPSPQFAPARKSQLAPKNQAPKSDELPVTPETPEPATDSAPAPKAQETPKVAPDPQPTPTPEPQQVPQAQPTPAPAPKAQPAPNPTPEPAETPVAPTPTEATQPTPAPAVSPEPTPTSERASQKDSSDNQNRWNSPQEIPKTESVTTPESVASPQQAAAKAEAEELRAKSLAETKADLKTPEDLPLASSIETSSVAGDPLYTKEVDAGLDQLLTEWSIFKKSGLFGTGPKGREHPLFKKVADLQIPLLLAGRFEGATQEIKQSITDYMNGWRYEQGIIYKQGETFEHFLRRVIKHILDLQN